MRKLSSGIKSILAKPLFANMVLVAGITLLVKGLSFYKETLVVSTFGLSEQLDTFFIAFLIPSFVQNVFVGALKQLFIPNYIIELKKGENTGEFQSISFLIIIAIVLGLSLLSFIFVNYFLEYVFPNHSEAYYNLIKIQFYVILPALIFWSMGSIISGLLEIGNKFLISSISPIFMALSTIFCLFFLNDFLQERVLAFGILFGSIISFVFLLYFTLKNKLLLLKKPKINNNIKNMINQLPPKITSGLLTGINPFVDQFFAAQLVVGSIASINYGVKVPQFVIGILMLAIGNVFLPHFSKLVVEDINKAYQQLFKILKLIFVSSAILAIIVSLLSENIISLLFERNEFTHDDTVIVSKIQQIVLVYVPFFLCTMVMVNFLTSINKIRFMAYVSLWNFIANLILNYFLIQKYGVYGLVLSTTVVYVISSLIYFKFTKKHFNNLKSIKL
ncbi:lipid II flippase MurJ [Aurantibacter sp.]|uniref:murein biosynthesis integral membrane protein MurJ n=1 Tax=Aurantibacter sp. TaxID=2807103 RepID=UPI003267832F